MKHLLRPTNQTSWVADALFFIVPMLMLLPVVFAKQPEPGREYEGTFTLDFDGFAGVVTDLLGIALLVLFLSVSLVAGIRLVRRIKSPIKRQLDKHWPRGENKG